MKSYIVSSGADNDLDDIWLYVSPKNGDAADRLIEGFFSEFRTLAQNPGFGHLREDLTDLDLLFWPVGSYLVIYRALDPLVILAVIHGARDIPAFLDQRLTEH